MFLTELRADEIQGMSGGICFVFEEVSEKCDLPSHTI
jgi:hypothetical protein